MSHRGLIFLSISMTMSLSGCAQARTQLTAVDRHPFAQLTLENGLQVVWQEDHRQPLIAIDARILGGLRGEGAYLGTGITHAIEHMLFKGTPSRPPGTIDQEVRRYGGTINAFTSHDSTGVSLFVESRFLPQALEMLADILTSATFPEEEFVKERAVILSELDMNRDDPERRLQQLFWSHHLLVHPYRHPILGYRSLLEKLTVEDMRALHKAQYVPNNVVLACVGDVDSAAFPELVRRTFGAWPRGAPYQVAIPEEPPAVSVRQVREELPVQAAYGLIGFPSTRLADPDLYALDVLAGIVGQGQSSRLYETLVRTKRVAHSVGAANYTPFDPGAFTVFVRTDPGQVSVAVDAALEVLEAVKGRGVTEQELNKAKRQVVAAYVFHRQTIESKADDLAGSLAMTGDPAFSARYVDAVERLTAGQIQQAAVRYLDRAHMTLATVEPAAAATAPLPPPAPSQPAVSKTTLPNGLTVLVGQERQLPMAVIVAVSRGGVRAETQDTQGLSNLMAQLLLKGTSRRSATQIASDVESLGGALGAFSGRDGFGLSLQLLSEDLPEGLALIHELLTDATFPKEELDLQRQLILKELEARDDDVFDLGGRLLRRTLFASHPYRFDPMGSKETIARLTREDCLRFAKQYLVPGNLVIAVFGDVQADPVRQTLERQFGRLTPAQAPWPQTLPEEKLDGIRQASLTLPKEQSVIMMGFPGTRVTAADRDTLDVLTAILSGMSGRLFQAVRERQGLSYTLGAVHVPGWDPGYLMVYAATRPGDRQAVLDTLQRQVELMARDGVTEEELAQAKQYLIGAHRLDIQRLGGLAKRCALDELYGLGAQAWTQYESRIRAVSAAMVQEAARQYLRLPQRAEIIVGPDGMPPVEAHAAPERR